MIFLKAEHLKRHIDLYWAELNFSSPPVFLERNYKMARYISLYSGSTGNCSVVEKDGKFILIDVGKSAKITNTALKDAGLDIKNLQGVLVSH